MKQSKTDQVIRNESRTNVQRVM